MTIVMNWLIALAVILLLFAGLYFIVKLAVKGAVREVIREEAALLAKKLWEDEDTAAERDDNAPQA